MANNCTLFLDKQHYCVGYDTSEVCYTSNVYLLIFMLMFQTVIYAVKQTVSSLELIGR